MLNFNNFIFSSITEYLCSTENLAHIAKNIGIKDLIMTEVFFVYNIL